MSEQPSLKSRIRNGELIIGVVMSPQTTRSQMEDILAKDDYAYILADSQHAAFNEERLVEFCGYADELNMPVQFRIKHTRHTYLIGNILDLGPVGVEVPQVETMATVDEALAYFYYPQQGIRSWGGPKYGKSLGLDRLGYADYWNNTGVLWMQIESINAVTRAGAFAKAGVDCLSWGPADLSFNLDAHPNHPFKTDNDCLRHVLTQLEGTDVKVAYRNYDHKTRNKYIDMGVTVLLERPQY